MPRVPDWDTDVGPFLIGPFAPFDPASRAARAAALAAAPAPPPPTIGIMPAGRMTHSVMRGRSLPGHPDADGVITIDYSFAGGTQGPEHLRPGVPYTGTHRVAYLPNNAEGQLVRRLLEKAFEYRLTFTVGDDVTSGAQNTVVWNNAISHKTRMHGSARHGYPDPTYLQRLKEELAELGITEALL